ncbi:hypothetical protein [Roseibium sp.]|uniref:hypothetical protein n=1 Tax=Roseibium sp. TaxID=1936156 RepID=UPI003D098F9A
MKRPVVGRSLKNATPGVALIEIEIGPACQYEFVIGPALQEETPAVTLNSAKEPVAIRIADRVRLPPFVLPFHPDIQLHDQPWCIRIGLERAVHAQELLL